MDTHDKAEKAYKLSLFALSLNVLAKRDWAIARAREFFELGHCEHAVRTLILEARMHNSRLVKLKRAVR